MNLPSGIEHNLELSKITITEFVDFAWSKNRNVFVTAIINLMREACRELDKLVSAPPDLTIISIGTRNIFEIYLISRHIYTDEKWLNNWIGQLHKDAVDIQDGLLVLMKKHNKQTTELEVLRKFSDEYLEQSDYDSKGGFNMKDLADRYGHSEDYVSIHKLCSKLIHPTSMKINVHDALTANSNFTDTLKYVASYFAIQLEKLADEIKESKFA